jgi:hypothetical protein
MKLPKLPKLPRLDGRDGLVVIAASGLGAAVKGVAMLSPAYAWILCGVALVAWAIWRLR